jgi:hypothetical protein
MREAGQAVEYSFTPARVDKQFKKANEVRATHTLKLERLDGDVRARLKHLRSGKEELVALDQVLGRL